MYTLPAVEGPSGSRGSTAKEAAVPVYILIVPLVACDALFETAVPVLIVTAPDVAVPELLVAPLEAKFTESVRELVCVKSSSPLNSEA